MKNLIFAITFAVGLVGANLHVDSNFIAGVSSAEVRVDGGPGFVPDLECTKPNCGATSLPGGVFHHGASTLHESSVHTTDVLAAAATIGASSLSSLPVGNTGASESSHTAATSSSLAQAPGYGPPGYGPPGSYGTTTLSCTTTETRTTTVHLLSAVTGAAHVDGPGPLKPSSGCVQVVITTTETHTPAVVTVTKTGSAHNQTVTGTALESAGGAATSSSLFAHTTTGYSYAVPSLAHTSSHTSVNATHTHRVNTTASSSSGGLASNTAVFTGGTTEVKDEKYGLFAFAIAMAGAAYLM